MNNSLKLIFNEVKERLSEQLLSISQLSEKFNFLLAFNGIIIASIFQGIISANQFKNIDFFLGSSVFLLLLSVLMDLRGLILQKYRRDPDPERLYKKYNQKQPNEIMKILILNYTEAFNFNVRKLHKVNTYFTFSIAFSSAALVFIFLFLIKPNVVLLWETMTKTMCQK